MENLRIDKTKTTPQVYFNPSEGVLEISGESYPENAMQFYQQIFKTLKSFTVETKTNIVVNFKLDYFNTSSSKCILNIMEILEEAYNGGRKVELNWYHRADDDDMLESGQEFAEDMSIPFNFISF